jgi:hypothetical protein
VSSGNGMSAENNHDILIKRLQEVKEKNKERLLRFPNVTGVGVGYKKKGGKKTDEISLRVYVRKKVPLEKLDQDSVIPKEIDGVQIDVIEGDFHIHGIPIASFQAHHDPLKGGISIINLDVFPTSSPAAGTLGGTAFDNVTRDDMIVSCWHVLCWGSGQVGDSISQPGSIDGGDQTDVVGTLYRSRLSSRVDAAIAQLNGSRYLDQEILGFGRYRGTGNPSIGLSVKKGGRTTGNTFGEIVDVSADVNVAGYPGGTRSFVDQIIVESITSDPFSAPGDSGSLVLNDQNQVIALLFAGDATQTMCNKISHVMSELDVHIDHGLTLHDNHASLMALLFS